MLGTVIKTTTLRFRS